MKQNLIVYFLVSIFCFLLSCNSESANDCVKKSGNTVKREIQDLSSFNKIRVEEGVELILFQDSQQKIEIEAGENLINDVSVQVVDGELIVKNNISCNWFRSYTPAKAYVTFTEINRIYSVSQHKIHAAQTLSFDHIELSSGVFNEAIASEFYLTVHCNHLKINANDATYFNLSGNANSMFVAFWGGEPRIDAPNLKANSIEVFQRSSNDMVLHPLDEIKGNIYSTGNIVLKNNPISIDITQHYTGKLIID